MNMKRMGFVQKHTCKFQNPSILAKVKDIHSLNQRKNNYPLKSQTRDQRSAKVPRKRYLHGKAWLQAGLKCEGDFRGWVNSVRSGKGRREKEGRGEDALGDRWEKKGRNGEEERGGGRGGDRWWRGAGSNRTWKDTRSWYAVISTHYHAQCRQQGVTLHPLG